MWPPVSMASRTEGGSRQRQRDSKADRQCRLVCYPEYTPLTPNCQVGQKWHGRTIGELAPLDHKRHTCSFQCRLLGTDVLSPCVRFQRKIGCILEVKEKHSCQQPTCCLQACITLLWLLQFPQCGLSHKQCGFKPAQAFRHVSSQLLLN